MCIILCETSAGGDTWATATCSTRMPRASNSRFFFSSAKEHKTKRSSCTVLTTRDSSGNRRRESTITRNSGRRRGLPERSVSKGSSAIIVPTPTIRASLAWRSSCTWARAVSLVIHPPVGPPDPPDPKAAPDWTGGGAILPSSVIPAFNVTSGSCQRMYFANDSFSLRASSCNTPSITSMPAARSCLIPLPSTIGFGSRMAVTTRFTPEAVIASVQGPVRPWWQQGSRFR